MLGVGLFLRAQRSQHVPRDYLNGQDVYLAGFDGDWGAN